MKLLNGSDPESVLSQEFRYRAINLAPNPISFTLADFYLSQKSLETMRIKIRAVVGGEERNFDMPCGEGDKSFKWLSNCASQRFALFAPNGTLRRKEGLRGATKHVQATPLIITLANGDSPHPASILCDS